MRLLIDTSGVRFRVAGAAKMRPDFKDKGRQVVTRLRTPRGEVVMMTPDTRPPAGPATGPAWQPARRGQARPLNAGMLAFAALPTSPFSARR